MPMWKDIFLVGDTRSLWPCTGFWWLWSETRLIFLNSDLHTRLFSQNIFCHLTHITIYSSTTRGSRAFSCSAPTFGTLHSSTWQWLRLHAHHFPIKVNILVKVIFRIRCLCALQQLEYSVYMLIDIFPCFGVFQKRPRATGLPETLWFNATLNLQGAAIRL